MERYASEMIAFPWQPYLDWAGTGSDYDDGPGGGHDPSLQKSCLKWYVHATMCKYYLSIFDAEYTLPLRFVNGINIFNTIVQLGRLRCDSRQSSPLSSPELFCVKFHSFLLLYMDLSKYSLCILSTFE